MVAGLLDRPRLKPSGLIRPPVRIVHLGLGAFFRAHVASYLADLGGWGVLGVSLRNPSVRDALAPQDYVYTVAELAPDGIRTRQIEVVRGTLVAPESPQAVIDAMADRAVSIVSLTVTEKGYCLDPATGQLNVVHPDIVHDIGHELPRSAIGFLVRGLQARRSADTGPLTIMSCDNIPDNGGLTRHAVLDFAKHIDSELAAWITETCAFPSSMVDRIVPATTVDDIAQIGNLIDYHDAAVVMHESFRQWVIEDSFAGDRPALDTVDAQMVTEIAPFENIKLRMLNGAHSALAYLGYLMGHKTVAGAASDPVLAAYLHHLWTREIMPTLTAPPDTDLNAYANTLLGRFSNAAICHNTYQIAMDGSQKLPQRLLGTIADRLNAGQSVDALLLAVAAWMRYTGGVDEKGSAFVVQDPFVSTLQAAHSSDPAMTVRNFLALRDVFDETLAAQIEAPLIEFYKGLAANGARQMMEKVTT